ncbi:hypothetical protein [Kitasatospora sp. NPDC008115]|uniref:hypothetical protein n=1 Tax=Kitasatospora sp. NPDC008115 TaxID=3364022 RepID=UPI0036ED2852
MLTVTTTGQIAAWRGRVEQAEADLATATDQLADLMDQQRDPDEQLLAALSDLATTRDALARAEQTAAEAMADEARTKSVCDVMVKDAAAQLAARERTIVRLRADLEQALARKSAEPELPEHTVLRFLAVGGGLVVVTVEDRSYAWRCLACGDDSGHYSTRDDMRRRANDHAAGCRAIPARSGDTTKTKEEVR